jgi:hypothetical protein
MLFFPVPIIVITLSNFVKGQNKIILSLTKASRPTPNSVSHFSAMGSGGAAHARRYVS